MEDDKRKKLEKVKSKSLKRIRDILPIIKSLDANLSIMKEELRELNKVYKDYKERYRVADYQLAELDKRVRVIPTGRHKVSAESKQQLTISQIKKVANKLGIKL